MPISKNLEKAKFSYTENGSQKDIYVLINPSEISAHYANDLSEENPIYDSKKTKQKVIHSGSSLSMQLYFDGYVAAESKKTGELISSKANGLVNAEPESVKPYIDQILYLLDERKDGSDTSELKPVICKFDWGEIKFEGHITSCNVQYTMFTNEGMPVRARVDVNMKAFKMQQAGSQAITKKNVVIQTHADFFNSSASWRSIADANKIDNPRILVSGTGVIV